MRNSAAAMAPEMRPRAAKRRTSGRRESDGAARRGRRRRTSAAERQPGRAARAAGAWTKKIERHPSAWVRAPPMAGPAAVPSSAAMRQSRSPWPGASVPLRGAATRTACAVTSSAAPPRACTPRATSRRPSVSASPQTSEPEAEERHPRQPERADAERPAHPFRGQQRDGQHDRVDAQHRGDAGDVRVQLEQYGRKGERDDCRVGEREKGDRCERKAHEWTTGGRQHVPNCGFRRVPRGTGSTTTIGGLASLLRPRGGWDPFGT